MNKCDWAVDYGGVTSKKHLKSHRFPIHQIHNEFRLIHIILYLLCSHIIEQFQLNLKQMGPWTVIWELITFIKISNYAPLPPLGELSTKSTDFYEIWYRWSLFTQKLINWKNNNLETTALSRWAYINIGFAILFLERVNFKSPIHYEAIGPIV